MSTGRPRFAPGAAAAVPEPPDSTFWLERTPLPTGRRAGTAEPDKTGRSALAPPSTVCPKCDSPLSPSEPACPSCGLKRAMFGRFRASAADRVPPALEELWREVEKSWSDPGLHERFMSQVSLCGAYAYAASRYRRAARMRQSDAISKLQLERLSRMVHAVMAVSAVRPGLDERGGRPYRGLIALLVLLLGLGGIGSLYMFHKRRAQAQESIERVPSTIRVRRGRSLGPDGRTVPAFGGLRAPDAAHGKSDAGRQARARRSGQRERDEAAEPADQNEQGGQGEEDGSGTQEE